MIKHPVKKYTQILQAQTGYFNLTMWLITPVILYSSIYITTKVVLDTWVLHRFLLKWYHMRFVIIQPTTHIHKLQRIHHTSITTMIVLDTLMLEIFMKCRMGNHITNHTQIQTITHTSHNHPNRDPSLYHTRRLTIRSRKVWKCDFVA